MARPLELISGEENTLLAKITPPQSQDEGLGASPGAYCFVIDVSGSMNAAAQVTTEDGDKVNHGWSQLDIAKHSTNTFVASLGENDYVSVVTYSDNAKVLLEWTACDERGRETAIAKIHSMGPERSTNLTAGARRVPPQPHPLPPRRNAESRAAPPAACTHPPPPPRGRHCHRLQPV